MKFDPPLLPVKFVRRYKRFFADIELDSGELVVAHCPNTGSMKTCLEPGSPAWVSPSDNPKRKLKFTWEIAQVGTAKIYVNPVAANAVVVEGIERGVVTELSGYSELKREVKYGQNSRIDVVLSSGKKRCYVEVKNVTLDVGGQRTTFPDSVSVRATKHVEELIRVKQSGDRAVLLFCVSRSNAISVGPADDIDPVYGEALRRAAKQGVELLAYRVSITPKRVLLKKSIPVIL